MTYFQFISLAYCIIVSGVMFGIVILNATGLLQTNHAEIAAKAVAAVSIIGVCAIVLYS